MALVFVFYSFVPGTNVDARAPLRRKSGTTTGGATLQRLSTTTTGGATLRRLPTTTKSGELFQFPTFFVGN